MHRRRGQADNMIRSQTETRLRLNNISKSFRTPEETELVVLDDISFSVSEGQFVSLMGPSGCGKSTILNCISGLVPPDSGAIELDGAEIKPGELSFGYVFQEPRLLPWRTIEQNIEFALDGRGIPEAKHDTIISNWLDRVGLAGQKDNYPLRLSGGMRQRVGLARALAIDPEILLMDEPFSALDEVTARELRTHFVALWQETQKEVVFVTHNLREAILLSDKVLFMNNDGKIFNSERIPHSRPREMDNPEIKDIETRLSKQFFAELE